MIWDIITSHEFDCSIIPISPRTGYKLPFDNEIGELKLIIEVHGEQHYKKSGFHNMVAKKNNTTSEYELHMIQVRDRYKRMFVISKGYHYLEIPYWFDDKEETWKKAIEHKINEINIHITMAM